MIAKDLFRRQAAQPLRKWYGGFALPMNSPSVPKGLSSLKRRKPAHFAPALWLGAALIASGAGHLLWLWITGAGWSGPLSPRKPALFGLSAGVTVWSLAWVLVQLEPSRHDRLLSNFISGGLFAEVTLITIQYWRGVASHFNRSTLLDAGIESGMLTLILFVTIAIGRLCWRSRRLLPMNESRAIAIRAGLALLMVSCLLGLLATIAGECNLARGRSPELWGRAGVLKYPHGAALHAIQTLPLLSALLEKLRVANSAWWLRLAVRLQVLFLFHALWQTLAGRARLDLDLMGIAVLVAVGVLLLRPLFTTAANRYRSRPNVSSSSG